MSCDCLEKLEKKLVDGGIQFSNRKIMKARLRSIFAFEKNKMVRRPCIEMIVQLEGLKKEKTVEIAHGHCPFCGTLYETKEGGES